MHAPTGLKCLVPTVLLKKAVAFSPVRAITFPNSVMDGSSGIGHSVIAMAPSLNSLFPVGGNARNERGLAAIPLRASQTAH
jgi:hypothetical protein